MFTFADFRPEFLYTVRNDMSSLLLCLFSVEAIEMQRVGQVESVVFLNFPLEFHKLAQHDDNKEKDWQIKKSLISLQIQS